MLSRIPRLTQIGLWHLIAAVLFGLGSWAYIVWVNPTTQTNLALAFNDWLHLPGKWAVIWVGLGISLVSAGCSKMWPGWGMRPLMGLSAVVTLLIIVKLLLVHPLEGKPLWPLVLTAAGFIYLWWLAALLFDLVFVWHRYIRKNAGKKVLKQIRLEAPPPLRA